MEKKILNVGIIGCGGIANGKHMPALRQLENVRMTAFCDIIPEKAEKARAEFGTADAKSYTDYKDLLSDPSIDVVHVCTPNRSHSFITVDSLEAGKHVMCEKPMAINSAEAKKMLDAAQRTKKKLTIGYQCRQKPEIQFLKKMSDNGEFGDIYYAKALALRRRGVPIWGVFLDEYEQGGGPLIDIGTHALDMTLWIMDNYKPKYAVGTAYHKMRFMKETGNPWGDWDSDKFTVEDAAFGFIVMENGATINLESSWALNILDQSDNGTILCGTEAGGDSLCGGRVNGVKNGRPYVLKPEMSVGGVPFFEGVSKTPSALEAKAWIDAVINDTDPVVLPQQAYIITRILEGIYESAKTGKPYYFN